LELLQTYLKKHSSGDSLVHSKPVKGLKYIVVIPAYLETRLEESLVSLFNVSRPSEPVEVLVVINWPEDESQENIQSSHQNYISAKNWSEVHSSDQFRFHVVEVPLIPRKKAGVGFARKTGMDEAVRRFLSAGQKDGIIVSFDADTKCDQNYLISLENHFLSNQSTDGCSVYFEHPLEGTEYPAEVYKAITQYELHMRYYLHAVKYSGFPNAFYTVGSAFAVRAMSYCRQGGMNGRQAGEDFYFLQKFFDLGNFSDLLATKVCPSPRPSLRVPFGTGKAIVQILSSEESLRSYNPEIFEMLKAFFAGVPDFYEQLSACGEADLSKFHPCLLGFLESNKFSEELKLIFENSGSLPAFTKRFFRYFNMFRILKFARHARNTFPDLPVVSCAEKIMQKTGMDHSQEMNARQMLEIFRIKDRSASDLR
jgi:hypothetical protein